MVVVGGREGVGPAKDFIIIVIITLLRVYSIVHLIAAIVCWVNACAFAHQPRLSHVFGRGRSVNRD